MKWFLEMLSHIIRSDLNHKEDLLAYCNWFYKCDNDINNHYLTFESKLSILYQVRLVLSQLHQPDIFTLRRLIVAATIVGAKLNCDEHRLTMKEFQDCWYISKEKLETLELEHLRFINFQPRPAVYTSLYRLLNLYKTPSMIHEIIDETKDCFHIDELFKIFPEVEIAKAMYKVTKMKSIHKISEPQLKGRIMAHFLNFYIQDLEYKTNLYPSKINNEFLSTIKGMRNCVSTLKDDVLNKLIEIMEKYHKNMNEMIQLNDDEVCRSITQKITKTVYKLFKREQQSTTQKELKTTDLGEDAEDKLGHVPAFNSPRSWK